MTRRRIFTGGAYEEIAGYARAVVDGEWVFVSGTTGYDYANRPDLGRSGRADAAVLP